MFETYSGNMTTQSYLHVLKEERWKAEQKLIANFSLLWSIFVYCFIS